jgi:hypothetical protein
MSRQCLNPGAHPWHFPFDTSCTSCSPASRAADREVSSQLLAQLTRALTGTRVETRCQSEYLRIGGSFELRHSSREFALLVRLDQGTPNGESATDKEVAFAIVSRVILLVL